VVNYKHKQLQNQTALPLQFLLFGTQPGAPGLLHYKQLNKSKNPDPNDVKTKRTFCL